MKRPAFLICGIFIAVAGCSGSSNSSAQATSAQASGAQASSAAAPPSSEAVASDLPVYPGAVSSPELNRTVTRCGHKTSTTAYIVKDDLKTVADWYSAHMPGSVRADGNMPLAGGTSIAISEIFDPKGTRVAAVSQTHFAADIPAAARNVANAAAVHMFLETVNPGFSQSEMQDAQALIGSDPAARKRALAKTACASSGP